MTAVLFNIGYLGRPGGDMILYMTRRQLFLSLIAAPVAIVAVPPTKGLTGKRLEMSALDRLNYRRLALDLRKRLHYATNPDIRVGYNRIRIDDVTRRQVNAMWDVLRDMYRSKLIDNYIVETYPVTIAGWGSKWTIFLEKNGHREFVVTYYMPKNLEHQMERPGEQQPTFLGSVPAPPPVT